MTESLWQLLQENPADLTCDECFAVMEYYAELLVQGGEVLFPEITNHLEGCPSCRAEHRAALLHLLQEPTEKARPAHENKASVAQKERDRE